LKTYYDILGVQKQATPAELKKAFLLRCKLLHPDRFNQTTQKAEWDLANEMFKELNQAYDVLKNPLSRNQYDYKIGNENRPQSTYTAPPPPRTTPPPARPPKPSSAEPPPIPKNYPSANSSEQLKGCGPVAFVTIALVLIIGAFNKTTSPTIANVEKPLSDNEKKLIVRDPQTIAVQSQISELTRKIDQENEITKKEELQRQKDDIIRVYQESRGIKVALKQTPSPSPKNTFSGEATFFL
jgi:curved DNA-binding protein CbpA